MRADTTNRRPGTPPPAPRQGAARLLRLAATLTGDPAPPATSEVKMAESKLPAISGPGPTGPVEHRRRRKDHQVAQVKWQ